MLDLIVLIKVMKFSNQSQIVRSSKSWKYRTYIYKQKAHRSSQRCMVERLGGISSQLLFQMVAPFPRRAFRGVGAEPATNLWLT